MSRVDARTRAVILVLILAVGAYLRFVDLRNTPGWYSDEGSDLDIARHLLDGEIRYMSISDSTFLVARPLAFNYLLSLLFRISGKTDILILRMLTSIASLVAVALLGTWGQRVFGWRIGLLAAGLLSIFPMACVYARIGFSYNLMQPLVLTGFFCIWEYLRSGSSRWLSAAAISLALSISINVIGMVPLAFLSAAVLLKRPRELLWFVPLSVSSFVLFTVFMLMRAPDPYLYDLRYTIGRTGSDALLQAVSLVFSYGLLVDQGLWFSAGFLGLLLAMPPEARRLWGYFVFFYLLVIGRAVLVIGSMYLAIPLLPYLSIGLAFGLDRAVRGSRIFLEAEVERLRGFLAPGRSSARMGEQHWGLWRIAQAVLVALPLAFVYYVPFVVTTAQLVAQLRWRALDLPDGFASSVNDAEQVIARMNGIVDPDDVTLASPQIGWALNGFVADFQQAAAYRGLETVHFPQDIPHSRFVFDPSLGNVDFVVLDDLWRGWASQTMPAVRSMVAAVEQWPLLMTVGEYSVHRNPGGTRQQIRIRGPR